MFREVSSDIKRQSSYRLSQVVGALFLEENAVERILRVRLL